MYVPNELPNDARLTIVENKVSWKSQNAAKSLFQKWKIGNSNATLKKSAIELSMESPSLLDLIYLPQIFYDWLETVINETNIDSLTIIAKLLIIIA